MNICHIYFTVGIQNYGKGRRHFRCKGVRRKEWCRSQDAPRFDNAAVLLSAFEIIQQMIVAGILQFQFLIITQYFFSFGLIELHFSMCFFMRYDFFLNTVKHFSSCQFPHLYSFTSNTMYSLKRMNNILKHPTARNQAGSFVLSFCTRNPENTD